MALASVLMLRDARFVRIRSIVRCKSRILEPAEGRPERTWLILRLDHSGSRGERLGHGMSRKHGLYCYTKRGDRYS